MPHTHISHPNYSTRPSWWSSKTWDPNTSGSFLIFNSNGIQFPTCTAELELGLWVKGQEFWLSRVTA